MHWEEEKLPRGVAVSGHSPQELSEVLTLWKRHVTLSPGPRWEPCYPALSRKVRQEVAPDA